MPQKTAGNLVTESRLWFYACVNLHGVIKEFYQQGYPNFKVESPFCGYSKWHKFYVRWVIGDGLYSAHRSLNRTRSNASASFWLICVACIVIFFIFFAKLCILLVDSLLHLVDHVRYHVTV